MTKTASKIRFKAKLRRPADSANTRSWSFLVLPKNAIANIGRTAIFEALVVDQEIERAIALNKSPREIRNLMSERGEKTLFELSNRLYDWQPSRRSPWKKLFGCGAPRNSRIMFDAVRTPVYVGPDIDQIPGPRLSGEVWNDGFLAYKLTRLDSGGDPPHPDSHRF